LLQETRVTVARLVECSQNDLGWGFFLINKNEGAIKKRNYIKHKKNKFIKMLDTCLSPNLYLGNTFLCMFANCFNVV